MNYVQLWQGDAGFLDQTSWRNMNTASKIILPAALLSLSLGACTWVDLDEAAKNVEVVKPAQAAHCEQLRKTTSQVMDKVWFMNRNKPKMAEELETLARNTAVEFGGNAVTPDSEIVDGKQTFIILDCAHLR